MLVRCSLTRCGVVLCECLVVLGCYVCSTRLVRLFDSFAVFPVVIDLVAIDAAEASPTADAK